MLIDIVLIKPASPYKPGRIHTHSSMNTCLTVANVTACFGRPNAWNKPSHFLQKSQHISKNLCACLAGVQATREGREYSNYAPRGDAIQTIFFHRREVLQTTGSN